MNGEQKKFLDENGLKILWNQISMHDYPNNAALTSVINAIDANKADKADIPRIDITLSAAGAAADAKAVGQAIENIELTPGPKGDSGVYVGASAPTDESVNVWINPNGEAADLPSGGGSTSYAVEYRVETPEAVSVLQLPFTDLEMVEKIMNADRVVMQAHIAKPTTDDTNATARGQATFGTINKYGRMSRYTSSTDIVPHPTDHAIEADITVYGVMVGERLTEFNGDRERKMFASIIGMEYTQNPRTNTFKLSNIRTDPYVQTSRFELSTTIPMGAGSYISIKAYRGDC